MRKIIIFLSVFFLALNCFAAENTTEEKNAAVAPANSMPKNESLFIAKDLEIAPKTLHEENKDIPYVIDVNFPEIKGDHLTPSAQKFNLEMSKTVTTQVEQFKKYVKEDMAHMKNLPESVKHNSLRIDYDIDLVTPEKETLISVRLKSEGFQAGRAHPYHSYQTFNYDFSKGKFLALADLFKPHSDYLKIIAAYAALQLNEKLKKDNWMIADGTKPIAKNFKNWNIDYDSLLITFDEYQVAPYVFGSQEADIPYEVLKKVILPNSPLAICQANPSSCKKEQADHY